MCNDDVGGFEYLVERKILVLMVEGKNFLVVNVDILKRWKCKHVEGKCWLMKNFGVDCRENENFLLAMVTNLRNVFCW